MLEKQLLHIRVLLAGLALLAHIGQHLPTLDEELTASEEADPAGTGKDPADGATDVAEDSSIPEHEAMAEGADLDADATQS